MDLDSVKYISGFSFQKICPNDSKGEAQIRTPLANYSVTTTLTILLPIVVIFGVIGNIISAIILRYTCFRLPSHFYLMCLSIWDMLALISLLPSFWAVLLLRPYYYYQSKEASWIDYYLMIWGICQTRIYATFLLRTLSVYTIVAFTLERAFGAMRPALAASWSTLKSSKIVMGVIILVSMLINLPWIFSFSQKPMPCGRGQMICAANSVFKFNRFIEFFSLIFIPSILICLGNGIIIYKSRQARCDNDNQTNKVQKNVTLRLLAISFAFIILTFPLLIVVMTLTFVKAPKEGLLANMFPITFFLYTINLAMNFLIYCFTAMEFRSAVSALFRCRFNDLKTCGKALGTPVETSDLIEQPKSS